MSTEKQKAASRAWAKKNRIKVNAAKRSYYVKNKTKIDKDIRERGHRKQGLQAPYPVPDNCEACGRLFSTATRGAYLDHCHFTGVFRGWLCSQCNSALGMVGDTPEGVRKLLQYIERAYDAIHQRLRTGIPHEI